MPTNVIMPSLGFDMTQGKLSRWLKNQGDPVKKGEAIAEVETEKATVEIEAFVSGTLAKILVQAGETVPVNTAIGIIAEAGETVETPSASEPSKAAQQPATTIAAAAAAGAATAVSPEKTPGNGRMRVSPVARRMAHEAGIDLNRVKGSGPEGRIMEKDVKAAIAQLGQAVLTAPASVHPSPGQVAPAVGELPLSRMRQTIAQRMTLSKTTTPHFYVTVEINMSKAVDLREQLNNLASEEQKVSINDLVLAATARILTKFAKFNASFRGDRLKLHASINLGIAVAVDDGLLTPTLVDADKKPLKQIAAETKGISERARANKLRPEDLTSSTFTVSNLGMFGVDEFAAIINPPEAAILAVGAVTKRAVVIDDQIRVVPTMKVTLAVDHRVADGAEAGRFLAEFKKLMENPVNLLLL